MLWNAFSLAARAIRRNVLRSFLTVLGIVIGVAAVIIMVTLGNGATAKVTLQISSLGSNLLMVTPGKRIGPGQLSGAAAFKVDDADAIARDISGIAGVAPTATTAAKVVAGNENWTSMVTGSTEQYFPLRQWSTAEGRLFSAGEARSGVTVCVIGQTVRSKLFGSASPIGQRLRVATLSCEVIGVLESKGQSSMGTDQDDLVVLPLRTFQRRISGNDNVAIIQIGMRDGSASARIQQDVRRLMRERRHLSSGEEDDFSVMDMKEIADMLSGTTRVLTGLLGAVAAVSLLVGGIGIMNIMLVSVTERTREIGIRLAIGALERDVLLQFLVEAVVLSSLGGILGIVIALAASVALAALLGVPFVLNLGIVLVAFLFAAIVGIVFGYFPARKAASLNPIDALRHE
ncbi:FtsX-like permease family protein [Sinimarinibacterium sp. CAU 1509]|uniref:ABC transporter permease n=1 Tax=Sinimarinibacterium sp. CAU 1509 TaxID=2562283 RepID=UPI0010AD7268|nr:ABC transporter permease [Sinimarinibacterium sp. CAU 1509]TJY62252.1 FtsX-like permease family protein [Sinimarinibacterium sp. CAU 1509]